VRDDAGDARGGLGTVRNAALLLGLLAAGSGYLQLTELAERSGLSYPTVHRLLRSLTLADLVHQDPRSARYGLGPGLVVLSHRYLSGLPILTAINPYLVQLRDELRLTVEVQVIVGTTLVTVDQVDGSEVGIYRSPHATCPALDRPAGRLLAARLGEPDWQALLDDLEHEAAAEAAARRADWAASEWLHEATRTAGTDEVAVVLTRAEDASPPAALAVATPPRLPEERVAEIVESMMRARNAADRTRGYA